MADYAKMYQILFRSQTQAIETLMKAQQETEELYISSPEPDIRVLDSASQNQDDEKE